MSDGRSVWYAEDADWMTWERVEILGGEMGGASISVLCALKCAAKRQAKGWLIKTGFTSLSKAAFTTPEFARAAVERAAELGILDDLQIGEFTFTCRVSGMAASERKARDAARKAADRDAPPATADTSGHERTNPDTSDAFSRESRTEENREEQNDSANAEPLARDPKSEAVRLAQLLSSHIRAATRTPPTSNKHRATRQWAADLMQLHTIEQRSWTEIEAVIQWLSAGQGDAAFWQPVIDTPGKFRAKFEVLAGQAARPARTTGSTPNPPPIVHHEPAPPDSPAAQLWARHEPDLRSALGPDYDLWLQSAHPVRLDTDGSLILAVAAGARHTIQRRYAPIIERVIGQNVRTVALAT